MKLAAFTASLNTQMKAAGSSTSAFNTHLSKMNVNMDKALMYAKRFALVGIGAVGAAFAYSVKTGAEFEYATQKVGNIAGASAEQMQKLAERARELGETTAYTATQVMDGMQSLASMGMTTDEVSASIENALQLAGTFGSDMGTAASGIAVAIKNFGLAAEDTEMIVDRFTATVQNSRFSGLEPMMGAFKEASANAGALGMDLDDVLVGIKFFTDAGYEASRAGSMFNMAIRTAAQEMPKSVKALNNLGLSYDDIDPKAHGFVDIVRTLATTQMTATDAMDIFGSRAGLAFKRVVDIARETPEALQGAVDNLTESGGKTADAYEALMDTVKGWWDQLKSAVEAAALTVYDAYKGQLKETLEGMTEKIREFAEYLGSSETQEGIRNFFITAIDTAKKLYNTLKDIYEIANKIPTVIDPLAGLKLVSAYSQATGAITNAKEVLEEMGEVQETNMARLEEAGYIITTGFEGAFTSVDDVNEAIKSISPELKKLGINVEELEETAGRSLTALGAELEAVLPQDYQVVIDFESNTIELEKIIEKTHASMSGMLKSLTGKYKDFLATASKEQLEAFITTIPNITQRGKEAIISLSANIKKSIALAGKEGMKEWSSEITKKADEVAQAVGKGFFDSTDTPSFEDWSSRVNTVLYERVKMAMEQAFIDAIISKQIIQPLISLLEDIDLNSQEGMNKIRETYDQVQTKMEALYPTVQKVTDFLKELAPAAEEAAIATQEETAEIIDAAQKIADMGSELDITNPTIRDLANAADNAADELNSIYKTGSEYSPNTRDPSNPFISPVTFSSFDVGSSYVPRTGPAVVHEGETIIRKSETTNNRAVNINLHITALDPIGMKSVVEKEIIPLISQVQRRTW